MHEITLTGYTAACATASGHCLSFGTRGSYGIEKLRVIPGDGWEDMLISVTFHPPGMEPVRIILDETGVIDVPQEATAVAATEYAPGKIVFCGCKDGATIISADRRYLVDNHAETDGAESEPTPSQWEQLVAQYQSKVDKQQGAENAGKFLAVGENGEVALSEGVKPEQIAAAVDAYLDENPIEAGATPEEAAQIRQNKTDIETLQKDKLSTSELDSAIDSALAQAKASGEFDGKDGDPFTYDDFTEEQLAALKGEPGKDYTLTEADKQEIAEQAAQLVEVPEVEIPDKLPNPNALTFSGAVSGTYDGSAPMTVEIPQGGAGGGGGKTLTLINEITFEEEVAGFDITTDKDGNPLNEEYMVIKVRCLPKSTAGKGKLLVFANWRLDAAFYNGSKIINSAKAIPGSDWQYTCDTVCVVDTVSGTAFANTSGQLRGYNGQLGKDFTEPSDTPSMNLSYSYLGSIPNIQNLHCEGTTLGAGSKIWIYSMR